MSKIMPKSTAEEKLRWIKPILDNQIKIKDLVKVCPFSERSIKNWLSAYRKFGLAGLENKSTRPKSHPNETSIRVKERILELRREQHVCAVKLAWKLKKEEINVHPRTIGKIIKQEGLTRKYRTRRIKYKYVKAKLAPGELVEIDIKHVPQRVKGKKYYQFTAIDCSSRWRVLKIFDDMSSHSAICFLQEFVKVAPFKIKAVKTDNGSCFTNRYTGYLKSRDILKPRLHDFDLECQRKNIEHYLIDPGKPSQNGKVERSHRSDQESFYDRTYFASLSDLKLKIKRWNTHYNNLEHCGLNGLTPNQALNSKVQYVRT